MLEVGQTADPRPGPGEVRVRLTFSGINPADTKKRVDWTGSGMPYPRVIPHSDGAGVVDEVGDGVAASRIGKRVWVYGAQSYRPFGTAAQFTVVPADQAGPPAAWGERRARRQPRHPGHHRPPRGLRRRPGRRRDGPGPRRARGGVGSLAAQLAAWNGATVIGTVRHSADLDQIDDVVEHRIALDSDPVEAIRRVAPDGVHHTVEVSFSENADFDAAVAAPEAVIAAYATRNARGRTSTSGRYSSRT